MGAESEKKEEERPIRASLTQDQFLSWKRHKVHASSFLLLFLIYIKLSNFSSIVYSRILVIIFA